MSSVVFPDCFAHDVALRIMEETPTALADSRKLRRLVGRTINCYSAHFQSWCQAFGEHRNIAVDDRDGCWLLGETQVGLIMSKPLFRQFNREVVFQGSSRTLVLNELGMSIGNFAYRFKDKCEEQVLAEIEQIFETYGSLHLFRTEHFLYGHDKRILTISGKRPPTFIYRKVGEMILTLH